MNKKILNRAVVLTFGATMLFSCGGEEAKEEGAETNVSVGKEEEPKVETDTEEGAHVVEHRLPTPNQFFEFVKKVGGESREDLLNPIENMPSYHTEEKKALNFGVYFADLAYMNNFEINANSYSYLKGLSGLAENLNISKIFNEELVAGMQANSENADSLQIYSSKTYQSAYSYLEDNNKRDVLSYMLAGGWVESMHIAIGIAGEYSEENQMIQQIADQNVVLESIYEHMLISSQENESLVEMAMKLEELKGIFDANKSAEKTKATTGDNGKVTFGGGSDVILDKAAFGTIVEKIAEIRSEIITNE